MNWDAAKISLLLQKFAVDTDINSKASTYRFVLASSYAGIRTRVGKSSTIVLDFPFL